MVGISDNIISLAKSRTQFSVDDLLLSVAKGVERNTLSWHLSNLCKLGKLRRVGRGIYSLQDTTSFIYKGIKKSEESVQVATQAVPPCRLLHL